MKRGVVFLIVAGVLGAGVWTLLELRERTFDHDYSNWSLSPGLSLEGSNSSSLVELNRTELEAGNPYLLGLLDTAAETGRSTHIPDSRIDDLQAYLTAKAGGKDWRYLAFEGYSYSILESGP
jgi:hypothetical protein